MDVGVTVPNITAGYLASHEELRVIIQVIRRNFNGVRLWLLYKKICCSEANVSGDLSVRRSYGSGGVFLPADVKRILALAPHLLSDDHRSVERQLIAMEVEAHALLLKEKNISPLENSRRPNTNLQPNVNADHCVYKNKKPSKIIPEIKNTRNDVNPSCFYVNPTKIVMQPPVAIANVVAFIKEIILIVIPLQFFGTIKNREIFLQFTKLLLTSGSSDVICLHLLMANFKVKQCK